MTKIEALVALRDAVKVGECDFDWGYGGSPSRKALPLGWHDAMNAFNGSLDAARNLHETLLPGWDWELDVDRALVDTADPFDPKYRFAFCKDPNTARAWLIAILEALIAGAEE